MSCILNIHEEKFYVPGAQLLEEELLKGETRIYMHQLPSHVMHFHKNLLWCLIIFQRYI